MGEKAYVSNDPTVGNHDIDERDVPEACTMCGEHLQCMRCGEPQSDMPQLCEDDPDMDTDRDTTTSSP